MFDPAKYIEWLKLPTKTLVALCIANGLLLFPSGSFLTKLGLDAFMGSYRPLVGVVFVVTLSLSAISGISALLAFIWPWVVQAIWIRAGRKRLQKLNPEEKRLLSHYINNQTRSQRLSVQSGVVNALVQDKVILRASNLGNLSGFDYNIQPWAWEYLNENRHLLE